MKLLLNSPIKLYKWWKKEELERDLFKRCGVFVKDNIVVEQKVSLRNEGDFCDVLNSLEYLSKDGFDVHKCIVYSDEGTLVFVWQDALSEGA